jgi:hypothetical protein
MAVASTMKSNVGRGKGRLGGFVRDGRLCEMYTMVLTFGSEISASRGTFLLNPLPSLPCDLSRKRYIPINQSSKKKLSQDKWDSPVVTNSETCTLTYARTCTYTNTKTRTCRRIN